MIAIARKGTEVIYKIVMDKLHENSLLSNLEDITKAIGEENHRMRDQLPFKVEVYVSIDTYREINQEAENRMRDPLGWNEK